ncbi:hypothetical protein, partial [Dietzia sp. 111N12-1]|uniref:hypothetical protein n=1 Tax=Dietzia sp. 111N12-1 TaxID=1785156 RepID=UPI000AD72BD2
MTTGDEFDGAGGRLSQAGVRIAVTHYSYAFDVGSVVRPATSGEAFRRTLMTAVAPKPVHKLDHPPGEP